MKEVARFIKKFFRGADFFLLLLCLAASAFGCVLVSSAARSLPGGAWPYLRTQIAAIAIGVVLFLVITLIDTDFIGRCWKAILAFNVLFILLLVPFGVVRGGNKSWFDFSFLPMAIQPAEIVKIGFIILLATQMYALRDRINRIFPMMTLMAHLLLMVGMIIAVSGDTGVALIYVFIFLCMMIGAGVKPRWFAAAGVALAAAAPFLWSVVLTEKQRTRVIIALNPYMDPSGAGWHSIQSMNTVGGGQMLGQGLYQGKHTQMGDLFGGHTDFVFSVCAEELGFVGCLAVILLLTAIIIRCLYMATRAKNGQAALICVGVAGMLIFQTFLNVGMCVGLLPIVGLTLPFISYGGSSMIAMFAAMGLVSSVRYRPKTTWLDY